MSFTIDFKSSRSRKHAGRSGFSATGFRAETLEERNDITRDSRTRTCLFWAFFLDGCCLQPAVKARNDRMTYLTGVLTVAALFYLVFVMIKPEKF
jgi:hypothetical protein